MQRSSAEGSRSELPEPGAATWTRVQAVLAAAHQDVEGAARTLERMLGDIDLSAGPGSRLARAFVLRGLSRLRLFHHHPSADAVPPVQEAVDLLESLEDSPAIRKVRVGAFGDLANALMSAGRHDASIAAARAGLDLARGGDDSMAVVRALVRMGGQFAAMNRREESQECHAEALVLARTTGSQEAIGLALLGIGLRARERGAIDEAVSTLWDALRASEAAGVVGDQIAVLKALAAPDIAAARPETAREAVRRAEALHRRVEPATEPTPTEEDAVELARAGRWAEARTLWRRLSGGPGDDLNRLNAAICSYRLGERAGLAAEFAGVCERLTPPPRRHAALMALLSLDPGAATLEGWRFVAALGGGKILPWDLPALPIAVTDRFAIEEQSTGAIEEILQRLLAAPGGSPAEQELVRAILDGYAARRYPADEADNSSPNGGAESWWRRLLRRIIHPRT